MTWFTLSLLSVFALAVAELTQQYLLNLKNALNERASSVLTFLFQSLLTLPIILLTPYYRGQLFEIFNTEIFYKVVVVTIIASIAMIFYLKSFKVRNISISTIFVSGSAIVSTILGIIFFQESTVSFKFIGIACILGAIIILNFKNASLEKNHRYGILAGVMFGVAYTLDKSILIHINPLVYIFWSFFLIAFWGFILNPKAVIDSVKGKKLNTFVPIMISGVGYFLYNFFTFSAYRLGGEVGRIDAINNAQVFLIILFEFFILKHSKSIGLKLLTAILATIGVVLLGLY